MKTFTYIEFIKFQTHYLLKVKNQGKSKNTINSYRVDFRTFGAYTKENKLRTKISHFSKKDAGHYIQYLDLKYTSLNTRRKKVQTIRFFFDYLVEKNYISMNPFKQLPTFPKILNTPRPVSSSDMGKLWKAIDNEEKSKLPRDKLLAKRNRAIISLIIGCNLRPEEIALLSKSNVIINEGEGRIMILKAKKEPYSIPIPEHLIKYITDYIQYYISTIPDHDDILFFGANINSIFKQRIEKRGIQRICQQYAKIIQVNCSSKNLRQSCILRWINEEVPEGIIKSRMDVAPIYDINNYKRYKGEWNLDLDFTA